MINNYISFYVLNFLFSFHLGATGNKPISGSAAAFRIVFP